MRKAYSLAYSSISHGGELIIMLIIILLVYKFIYCFNFIKKPPDFSGGFQIYLSITSKLFLPGM